MSTSKLDLKAVDSDLKSAFAITSAAAAAAAGGQPLHISIGAVGPGAVSNHYQIVQQPEKKTPSQMLGT